MKFMLPLLIALMISSQSVSAQSSLPQSTELAMHQLSLFSSAFPRTQWSTHASSNASFPSLMLKEGKDRNNKQKWGMAMVSFGGAAIIGGGVMVARADAIYFTYDNRYGSSGDILGGMGIVLLSTGVTSAIAGMIIWLQGR